MALKDAGKDSNKKAEVVNQIAETISKINKAEDFTKQQDYIKHCSEILKIEESGLHALVNKFIRNRISAIEKKLPFGEAKIHDENAQKAAITDYDDSTFGLLFRDELQEREIARVLLEHGVKKWNDQQLIAEYIFSELVDESFFDNADILKLINSYKELMQKDSSGANKNYFIYHPDTTLSSLAVSLLNFPYEQSDRWRREFSQATGYQERLFENDYEDFIKTVTKERDSSLIGYLKAEEDKTGDEIESALNYLKLRKIKRMLIENQADLEKSHTNEEFEILQRTHLHLKQLEKELTRRTGTVIIR